MMERLVIATFLFSILFLSIISVAAQPSTPEDILNEKTNASCFDTSCGAVSSPSDQATTREIVVKAPADNGKKTVFRYILDYAQLGYAKIKKGTAYYWSKIRARFELLGVRKGQGGGAIRG